MTENSVPTRNNQQGPSRNIGFELAGAVLGWIKRTVITWPTYALIVAAFLWIPYQPLDVIPPDGWPWWAWTSIRTIVIAGPLLAAVALAWKTRRWAKRHARRELHHRFITHRAADIGLITKSGRTVRCASWQETPYAITAVYTLPTGLTPSHVAAHLDALAGVVGGLDAEIIAAEPRVVTVRYHLADALAETTAYPPAAHATYKAVPLGMDETGHEVNLGLIESNILLAGIPGSGKSGGLSALLTGISRLENVALIGIDPKKVELSAWRDRFSAVATEPDDATALLEKLVDEMNRRYDWLASHGLKKITTQELSPDLPLLVLVIDELADLVSTGVTKDEKSADQARSSMIRRLIAKGRAAGVVVITATQKPSSDVIPTSLRDLIAQRVAFATTTPEMTVMVLGDSARTSAAAHEIPPASKGVGYVLPEGSRVATKTRAYWVPDDVCYQHAAETAHLRVALPWL